MKLIAFNQSYRVLLWLGKSTEWRIRHYKSYLFRVFLCDAQFYFLINTLAKIIHHRKVPNVYKDQGYDWWGVRLQANCTISSFTISNGFILEANDMMVLVSQRSDQVQDNNTDLIINPTFDPSQSDCAFRIVTYSDLSYHLNIFLW